MILQDKVIIIAGATGAIGTMAAMKVAQAGAHVIVPYRQKASADRLLDRAGSLAGRFLMVESDGDSLAAMQNVVDTGRRQIGRIDGLVDLIGGFAAGRLDETDEALWHAQMQTNLHQAFYAARAVLPVMQEQKYGRMIFVSSISARTMTPGAAAYAVSKAALIALAKMIAVENKQHNILVQVLAPAMVNTEANRRGFSGDPAQLVQPEEIVDLMIFFLSDQIQHSSGNVIEIPGSA